MYLKETGEGSTTLILVHGGPALYGYMMTLGNLLKSDYRIVDYAQRGTYENPSSESLGIKEHLQDLDLIVEKYLPLGKVIIVGHSWGAYLALLYASQYLKVEKIIVLGTAPLNDELGDKFGANIQTRLSAESKKQLIIIENRFKEASDDELKNQIMNERLKVTGPVYHFNPATENLLPDSKWHFKSFQESINSIWDLIDKGNIPALLKNITIPVVAIHGDTDPIPCEDTFAFLKTNIKNIKTFMIKDAGHFPWLEETSKEVFFKVLKSNL